MKKKVEDTNGWRRRLRRLRRRLHLTQAQLASRLGVGASTVAHWEQELTEPQRIVQRAIAELEK